MDISQSFIKSYTDYKNGKECGLVIYEKYVLKNYPPPSDAMKKGIYFEWLCTGAKPLDGSIPEPEMVYKGTPKEKLSSDYERITKSVELYKKIINSYNIDIVDVSKSITAGGLKGIIDIVAIWNGKKVYIDLKYSGLINDKWSELGWETESLPYKDKLMIQGVHYKILAKESEGIDDIPFYYFVFNPQNPNDAKIIKQEVDTDRIYLHYKVVDKIRESFLQELKNGFTPYPSLSRCSGCYLFENCKHKVDIPLVETIYY
jgi:hypothetical protein